MLNQIREKLANSLISMMDYLLEDLPENSDKFLFLAKQKYQCGDYDGAVEASTTVIKNEPNNGEAFYWRCRAKYDRNDTVSALHDAIRGTELRPQHEASFYMLGNIYLRLENYPNALEAYSNAIELGDETAQMFVGRGYSKFGLKRYQSALADLETGKKMGFDEATLSEYIEEIKSRLENDG